MSCRICGGLRDGEATTAAFDQRCNRSSWCVTDAPMYFTPAERARFLTEKTVSLTNNHGHTAPAATVAPQPDPVNHPAHYKAGTYECREVIAALGLNFNRGSAFKYLWRAARKGRELEDLRKARACLDHEIALLERADGTRK